MLVLFVFFYSVQQGNIPEQTYLFQYKKKISVQKMLFPVRKYYFQSNTFIQIQIHGEIQTGKKIRVPDGI